MSKISMRKKKDNHKHPNPKQHQTISFVKSGVRIFGCLVLPFNIGIAAVILILSEIIGIIEELV